MLLSSKRFASVFVVDYPKKLAYIWQASEYSIPRAMHWWAKIGDFTKFARRGDLVETRVSILVRVIIALIVGVYWLVNLLSIIMIHTTILANVLHIIASILLYPIAVVFMSIVPVVLLRFAKVPLDRKKIMRARTIYRDHPGMVIAVAGSYGKTSMKELLVVALSADKKVASTPGNRNTLQSQAQFASKLSGTEEFVIVELGEGAPRDVAKMVDLIDPDYAVVTGLAPNHLDRYKNIEAIAKDFEALLAHVGSDNAYLNADSPELFRLLGTKGTNYSSDGFDGWVPLDVSVGVDSLKFEAEKCGKSFKLESKFVGRHNIGPMLFAIIFAERLGAKHRNIIKNIEVLKPYEHRMQARKLHGAWLIDDTYNGNIEGMIAGLAYLEEIEITGRKIYVTPGLVDQGDESVAVHERLGRAIADSAPDQVYLMKNKDSDTIRSELTTSGYGGKITIVDDPLSFYINIQDVLADGDVMLCQNDLPDQYQA